MSEQAKEVPLDEQLRSIPRDTRLGWDEGPGGLYRSTRWVPVGLVAHRAADELAALRARVAAAEADAARYRWLKAEHDAGYIDVLDWLGPYAGSDWDAAIDAESRIPDSAPEERT